MIYDIDIYVIGKGYTAPSDLSIGDEVYVIDESGVRTSQISSVKSEPFVGHINVINSGQFQAKATDSTRYFCVSENHGYDFLKWEEFPAKTRSKVHDPTKYLPVLAGAVEGKRSFTDSELDGLARLITARQYDQEEMLQKLRSFQGYDNYIFIDFLENWLSDQPGPGSGFPSGKNVKARAFRVEDEPVELEILKAACLSGFTGDLSGSGYLRINFESTPMFGSVPKPQKFFTEIFSGEVHSVNAENLPIMGRSQNKYCFVATSEDNNGDT